ncbi:sterol carrier family protein [Streptomyces sp. LaPpAH-108]|uniref:sterol carrier family protein n=1 Tax=Streptomyces sp. LaPpAH-108 TaxID=1155714 RepID=UPI0003672373|nr:sterol carrier family protein [Streptomyces sp. LaPpAH-108]
MPPARKRPRRYDPAKTRAAALAQLGQVREAVRDLDSEPVRALTARLAASLAEVEHAIARPSGPKPTLTPAEWFLAPGARPTAADVPLADLERRLRDLLAAHPAERLVETGAGVMTLDDFLVTRLVDLTRCADDLTTTVPGLAVGIDRQALAATTRVLADTLALKAPGASTEVRIPPYAVVQCVEGPRHTRGTPPNVVETTPLTWLRLTTGRLPWADALAHAEVSASGERADLSGLLPLLP